MFFPLTALENYIYSVRQTMTNDKFKDKMSADDKSKAEQMINDCQKWMDNNEHAEKDEYEAKQKEAEAVCMPILSRAYQSGDSGGSGDVPMDSEPMPGGDTGKKGPSVEEVD